HDRGQRSLEDRLSRLRIDRPHPACARMSYDLNIFFPHTHFPADAWDELLEGFRSDSCEVRFDEPAPNGCPRSCSVVADHSLIDISGRSGQGGCAPEGTSWEVNVSTTAGRSARAWFIQHAIPYHALVFFPGVTVHDCQYHVGRTLAASSWSTPES